MNTKQTGTHDVQEISFPDEDTIRSFTSTREYVSLACAVLRDVLHCVGLTSRAHTQSSGTAHFVPCDPCDRDEAIARGHLAKIAKLLMSIISEVEQERGDWLSVFSRLITEASVNLQYLLQTSEYNEYVLFSLQAEKSLLDEIRRRIDSESRAEESIEARMRASIDLVLNYAQVTEEQVRARSRGPLFGKNFDARAECLGFGNSKERTWYICAYKLPSHFVHGSWVELLRYHLNPGEQGFMPNVEWVMPEPEILLWSGWVSLDAAEAFANSRAYSGRFKEVIENMFTRNRQRIDILMRCLDEAKGMPAAD